MTLSLFTAQFFPVLSDGAVIIFFKTEAEILRILVACGGRYLVVFQICIHDHFSSFFHTDLDQVIIEICIKLLFKDTCEVTVVNMKMSSYLLKRQVTVPVVLFYIMADRQEQIVQV